MGIVKVHKICHLTSAHNPTDDRIYLRECQSLKNAGYDVTIIAPGERDEIIEGIKIAAIYPYKKRTHRMIKGVYEVYQRALDIDADVYHFHDPELIPVGLRLKRNGKKIIYDVHEDVPRQILSKQWIYTPLRKTVGWIVEEYENYAARCFNYVVTATPFIRDRFLTINKHSIDINNFPLMSELYVPDNDWSMKEKIVCFVGSISKIRGIYEMIDAICEANFRMLLAGDFETQILMEEVLEKRGWKNVIYLGYINRDEVKKVLTRSIGGIVLYHPEPNHVDAQPAKMFEYMSAGMPVVASNFPLWKEIIEGNNCGICVDPLNVNEIANAIRRIMDNPEQAKLMGENGRRAVEEKYNWEQEEYKLLNIYEELLR